MSDLANATHGTLLCDHGVHGPILLPPLLLSHGISQLTPLGGSDSLLASPRPTVTCPCQAEVDGSPRYEEAVTCCLRTPEQQNH